MKSLLTDPVVLVCCGAILVGFVGMFWAIAKLRRAPKAASPAKAPIDDFLAGAPDLRDLEMSLASLPSAGMSVPSSVPTPAVSKDVADRLESMTQRLAEMQTLLAKQASAAAADPAAHSGAVGQGFSPETIDKLLKIIGNVVQQVDILQKNLIPGKDGPGPNPGNPSASVTRP